jgi:hypothetical protein
MKSSGANGTENRVKRQALGVTRIPASGLLEGAQWQATRGMICRTLALPANPLKKKPRKKKYV